MVAVKQIGNKIKDLVAKAEEFNALSEEIACDLSGTPNEDLMELFTKVKKHEIEDAKTLMQYMQELRCFEEIEEKVDCNITPEIIEKFNKTMEAKEIIKEAIEVGVLNDAGAHRVYVNMKLDDGDVVWVPQTLEDAARSLVESNSVELLSNAIKERKETGVDQALLSYGPDIEEKAIRLQCENEPRLALKFSRYAETNTIAAFFIVDDENNDDNGELYDDLTVCLSNEYLLSDDYMAFVKSDKSRYLEVLQKRGILTCHQEVSYGNFDSKAVLVKFNPEKVVFEE